MCSGKQIADELATDEAIAEQITKQSLRK